MPARFTFIFLVDQSTPDLISRNNIPFSFCVGSENWPPFFNKEVFSCGNSKPSRLQKENSFLIPLLNIRFGLDCDAQALPVPGK